MIHSHVITGQTATGKTQRALSLAKHIGGYLISADSRQIYTGLTIITGKDVHPGDSWEYVAEITLDDNKKITVGYYIHEGIMLWGLDCLEPDSYFSAFQYYNVVENIISHTIVKNLTPIVVGGTYLYLKTLLNGLDLTSRPSLEIRNSLTSLSLIQLQEKLYRSAPDMWRTLNNSDRNNPHRLIRKIEVALTPHRLSRPLKPLVKAISYVGLEHSSPEKLLSTITDRVMARIHAGAEEEVKALLRQGYTQASPGLKTPGYQEIIQYLNGTISWDACVQKWILSEVQYAKRQKTFMKKDDHIQWETI